MIGLGWVVLLLWLVTVAESIGEAFHEYCQFETAIIQVVVPCRLLLKEGIGSVAGYFFYKHDVVESATVLSGLR